jgi:hypothetical protein
MVVESLMIGIEDVSKPSWVTFIVLIYCLEHFSFQVVLSILFLNFNQSRIIGVILTLYLWKTQLYCLVCILMPILHFINNRRNKLWKLSLVFNLDNRQHLVRVLKKSCWKLLPQFWRKNKFLIQ